MVRRPNLLVGFSFVISLCWLPYLVCHTHSFPLFDFNIPAMGYIMYEEVVVGTDMKEEGRQSLKYSSLVFGKVA